MKEIIESPKKPGIKDLQQQVAAAENTIATLRASLKTVHYQIMFQNMRENEPSLFDGLVKMHLKNGLSEQEAEIKAGQGIDYMWTHATDLWAFDQ